jgi:hypothetical protein
MVKKITILLFMILLTGCSVTYEITVDGNFIDETVKITEENTIIGEDVDSELDFIIWMNDEFTNPIYYYTKEKVLGAESSGIVFNLKSSYDEFLSLTPFVTSCYSKMTIDKKDNIIYFNTNGNFECFNEVDDLKLIIKSPFKILNSNADSDSNNEHVWSLRVNNNKPIIFEIDLSTGSVSESILDNFAVILLIVFGPIIVFVVSVYLIIRYKNKKFI